LLGKFNTFNTFNHVAPTPNHPTPASRLPPPAAVPLALRTGRGG
jgi:hypothetical protein